jgi:hypothetical protein
MQTEPRLRKFRRLARRWGPASQLRSYRDLALEIRQKINRIGYSYGLKRTATERALGQALDNFTQEKFEEGRNRQESRADTPPGEKESAAPRSGNEEELAAQRRKIITDALQGLAPQGFGHDSKFGSLTERFGEYGRATLLNFGGLHRSGIDDKPKYFAVENFQANASFRDIAGSKKLTKEYNSKRPDKIREFDNIEDLIKFAESVVIRKPKQSGKEEELDEPAFSTTDLAGLLNTFTQTDLFGNVTEVVSGGSPHC